MRRAIPHVASVAAILILAVSGCAPPVPGLEVLELRHDGLDRTYRLYAPESAASGPRPLLIALHRFTENGASMAYISQFNDLAEREGFIAVYPDARGLSFNEFSDEGVDDLGFILALRDELLAVRNVDPRRVYLVGASNGGFMTHRIACAAPDAFAAAAVIMATVPEDVANACTSGGAPSAGIPMLLIHGLDDPLVPADAEFIEAGPGNRVPMLPLDESIAHWVAVNECATTPETGVAPPGADPADAAALWEEYGGGRDGSVVRAYRVPGNGHTWPGGQRLTPAFISGPQSQDFAASEAIWQFFTRFPQ